ncbi:MAG: DUF3179 domain-containing protein [Actinobacteria bacterium]|nr:DUF3179 domain-containing protein [Actinomycetota bacterium]
MRPRRAWLLVVALLTACTVAPTAPTSQLPATADPATADPATAERTRPVRSTATDAATGATAARDADECSSAFYWEHPDCPLPVLVATDDIEPAGVGVDEIAPVDEPRFTSIAEGAQWLSDDSPLLVITIDGETKAYPLAILVWHEIVNDVVGGVPVVVTYCPLCNTGIVFERTVDGEVLDFGTSGHLWRSNLVMYDRQHENFWSQVYGRGIAGAPFSGRELQRVPALQVGFATLAAAHPDAQVLSRPTGTDNDYGGNPYEDYERLGPFFPSGPRDDRLDQMERVVGIGAPDAKPVAVTLGHLRDERVVDVDTPAGPVVVWWAPGQTSAVDGARVDDGRDVGQTAAVRPVTPDGTRLTFAAAGDGGFVDTQTGSTWDLFGRAVAGPLAGAQLEQVAHDDTFWFAWYAFHSSTRIVDGGG